jgi:hypothetical protein
MVWHPSTASATLTTFMEFTGNVGMSTNGWGSTTNTGTIQSEVPAGSTVLGAYLYTSTFSGPTLTAGGTLNGTAVSYTALPPNPSQTYLVAGRADVTSIVAPVINSGPGGVYNFSITETSADQDGEALVVVYSNPSLSTSTIGILDGGSSSAGDTSSINFSSPLDPTSPGFVAYMAIGDGFSYDGPDPNNPTNDYQQSNITVDGSLLTGSAGHCDDSADATCADGNLITVGALGLNADGSVNTGYSDPFTPVPDPTSVSGMGLDHELYNIASLITPASTTITVNTVNPSGDDNIFLEAFDVSGVAGFNAPPPSAVPEPGTLTLLGLGCLGLFRKFRRG